MRKFFINGMEYEFGKGFVKNSRMGGIDIDEDLNKFTTDREYSKFRCDRINLFESLLGRDDISASELAGIYKMYSGGNDPRNKEDYEDRYRKNLNERYEKGAEILRGIFERQRAKSSDESRAEERRNNEFLRSVFGEYFRNIDREIIAKEATKNFRQKFTKQQINSMIYDLINQVIKTWNSLDNKDISKFYKIVKEVKDKSLLKMVALTDAECDQFINAIDPYGKIIPDDEIPSIKSVLMEVSKEKLDPQGEKEKESFIYNKIKEVYGIDSDEDLLNLLHTHQAYGNMLPKGIINLNDLSRSDFGAVSEILSSIIRNGEIAFNRTDGKYIKPRRGIGSYDIDWEAAVHNSDLAVYEKLCRLRSGDDRMKFRFIDKTLLNDL